LTANFVAGSSLASIRRSASAPSSSAVSADHRAAAVEDARGDARVALVELGDGVAHGACRDVDVGVAAGQGA